MIDRERARPVPFGSTRAASAVSFLYWTGWQAMVPFIALYATSLGAGPAAVGAILGSYSVLALVLSLPAGVITERVGSGRMMLAGCLLGVASLLLVVYGGGLGSLVVGLSILGISQIMVSIGTQVEIILAAGSKDLPRAMTRFLFFGSASQLVGPLVGGALARGANYPAALLGAAGLSLLGAAASVAAARRRPSREAVVARPPAVETILSTLRQQPAARAGLLVNVSTELVTAFWNAFFPLLLTARGYRAEAVAVFFGLRAVSSTGVRLAIGRITRRLSRTRALVVGLLAAALALVAMALLASPVAIGAAVLLFGFATGLYFTLAAIAVAAGFPPEAAGVGVALRILAGRVGLITGPVVTGLVVQGLGLLAGFMTAAVICGSTALLYLPRPRLSAIRAARGRTVRH